MISSAKVACGALLALAMLGGCDGAPDAETPEVAASQTPPAGPSAAASSLPPLDFAALQDRDDPEQLLGFYAEAIRRGDWEAASLAWSTDAEVTPGTLEKAYGGDTPPQVSLGKGDIEGTAGSLNYEAPVVVTFSDGRPELRGTIVLRRVNDVPGASDEQLNWRIERSTALRPG